MQQSLSEVGPAEGAALRCILSGLFLWFLFNVFHKICDLEQFE